MAIKIGNNRANSITGTNRSDLIFGLNGADTINAGAGNDWVFAGAGNDQIFAGDGNDWVFAGTGNDMAYGGNGNDRLFGDSGDDVLDGGRGSDRVDGGTGSDTLIFTDAERGGLDQYIGGSGQDTLVLEFAAARWSDAAVKAEVIAYLNFLATGGTGNFTFTTMNLVVSSLEILVVKVDGVIVDPLAGGGTLPTGASDAYSTGENDILTVSPASGNGTLVDNDNTGSGAFTVEVVTGPANGALTLNANGSFSFNPGTAFDYLAAGQSSVESFTYQIVNSAGVSAPITVSLTITGANDAATIGGTNSGAIAEDNVTTTVSGALTISDADAGQAILANAGAVQGTYGTLQLAENGTWVYTINNALAATQALAAGVAGVESFAVNSADGTATSTITVTVNGTNDVAAIEGDLIGAVSEDNFDLETESPLLTTSGQVTVTDADSGQSSISNVGTYTGTYGSLVLQADGNWIYTLNNDLPIVQALGAGSIGIDNFDVVSFDGTTTPISISVQGTNDVASANYEFGAVYEDGDAESESGQPQTASGTITVSDVDAGEAGIAGPDTYIGTYGSLSVAADGSWTYTLDNDSVAVQSLGGGETGGGLDKFNIPTLGGDTVPIDIFVVGTDDAAQIDGTFFDSIYFSEGDTTANGFVTVSDIDLNESGILGSSFTGQYGELTFDENGEWTYTFTALELVGGEDAQYLYDSFDLQTIGGDVFSVSVEILDGFLIPS